MSGPGTLPGALLLRATLRAFWRPPWLGVLCVLGVALGVAAVVALAIARGSAEEAYRRANRTALGSASLVVEGVGGAHLDEGLYASVRRAWPELVAWPVVEGWVRAGAGDRSALIRVLGVDVLFAWTHRRGRSPGEGVRGGLETG